MTNNLSEINDVKKIINELLFLVEELFDDRINYRGNFINVFLNKTSMTFFDF